MTTVRRLVLAGAAVFFAVGLSACGERDQVTVYKQGKYQGKPDTKALGKRSRIEPLHHFPVGSGQQDELGGGSQDAQPRAERIQPRRIGE